MTNIIVLVVTVIAIEILSMILTLTMVTTFRYTKLVT